MKCPKCGADNLQFATNTHSSGYGFLDGCCGYMILGPLGLLCGACGMGSSTEEFWICQSCGERFSANDIEKQKQKEEKLRQEQTIQELCEQYKKELEGNPLNYYKDMYKFAQAEYTSASEKCKNEFKVLLEKLEPQNNLVMQHKKQLNRCKLFLLLGIILLIIGILSFLIGYEEALAFGMITVIISAMVLYIISIAIDNINDKLNTIFMNTAPDFKACIDRKEYAKSEKEHWQKLAEKAEYIEKNDHQ